MIGTGGGGGGGGGAPHIGGGGGGGTAIAAGVVCTICGITSGCLPVATEKKHKQWEMNEVIMDIDMQICEIKD